MKEQKRIEKPQKFASLAEATKALKEKENVSKKQIDNREPKDSKQWFQDILGKPMLECRHATLFFSLPEKMTRCTPSEVRDKFKISRHIIKDVSFIGKDILSLVMFVGDVKKVRRAALLIEGLEEIRHFNPLTDYDIECGVDSRRAPRPIYVFRTRIRKAMHGAKMRQDIGLVHYFRRQLEIAEQEEDPEEALSYLLRPSHTKINW